MDIVDERYVNSAYGISHMLAKGLSALIFQMISGSILDNIGGNQGYSMIYMIYTASIILALLLVLKFKKQQ